jgi:hypothetical protein
VPGYTITDSNSSREKPPVNTQPPRTTRPQHISPDFYVPGYTITDSNSSREKPPILTKKSLKESLKNIFNDKDDEDDHSDSDDFKGQQKCCKSTFLNKRKFASDNVPSSSGATSNSSNIGINIYSEKRFNELSHDQDLSREQINKKNNSYMKLQASQEYAYDAILIDEKDASQESLSVSDSAASSSSSIAKLRTMIKDAHIDLKQLAYCPTCNHSLKKSTRRSDKEFRDSVLEMTIKETVQTNCCGVKAGTNSINAKKCLETGGKCTDCVPIGTVQLRLRLDRHEFLFFLGDIAINLLIAQVYH